MQSIRFLIINTVFALVLFPCHTIYSQSSSNNFIDSIISKVSQASINKFNRELSGDTAVMIGGQSMKILSRQYNSFYNAKATQYLFEKLQSFGLQVKYDTFSTSGVNVIAKKIGTKYPNQKLIICAHYDDMISFGPPSDTVPGADDNASGVCGVLESARIFSTMNFDYTVIFAAWDEEETGLVGSRVFADSAFAHGDSIIAVINMDMLGWDSNNDSKFQVTTNAPSLSLANDVFNVATNYVPALLPQVHTGSYGSDQISFQDKGYIAVALHEDNSDFTPYYHTTNDLFSTLNKPFMYNLIKVTVGTAALILKDYKVHVTHSAIASSNDTSNITAKALIRSAWGIAGNQNKPRLYYKVGNGSFNFVTAQSNNLDTFYFTIPGQPKGSTVSYYIAAQDSSGSIIGSSPAGAKGLNPPGTIPPPSFFVYHINKTLTVSSGTVPKTINPMQLTLDTINISETGFINDINMNFTINHSNDSDLYVYMIHEGLGQIPASTKNGGTGDNYINTTLDDQAAIPITQGTAPFTGPYKPQGPFTVYNDKDVSGKWIIKIFNNSNTVTGQLISWSLSLGYYNPIAVENNSVPVQYNLSQNYPNPFNPSTKIDISIMKESDIKIIVHDILGREVSTLINDKLQSGNYHISFNGADLSSGMYFYSMYVDGALYVTKKMLLLK